MNIFEKKMRILTLIITSIIFVGCAKVQYLRPNDVVSDLKMQPNEALKLAKPFIETNATYIWRDSLKLQTHIVRKGKYYYIMQTDYPAKTINYYLQPAVKINSKNGKITFVVKK